MMRFKHAVAGVAVALALTGCQRTSYSDFGSTRPQQPAPLAAQPVGGVQSSALPDPTTDTTQFPDKPATPAPGTMPAENAQMAASALDVKKEAMVGNWKVSGTGGNCDMFLTLTNLGSGSRGGTRGCAGTLTSMGSWEVDGKQVALKDRSGNVIGRVYKTADSRLDGSLTSGETISLSR